MTLANKYRPKDFNDVIGQEVCTTTLNNQIKHNDFAHVLLFAGYAGCGKTTCARIFANNINGEIIELNCAEHNGVSDIKEIIDKARVKPLVYDYKVIILDECHALSSTAWQSLLYVLEEDFTTSIFVFCTTDAQKIPATILSRAQRLNFLPIPNKVIYDRIKYVIKTEKIVIEDNALKYIVRSAKGSMRQALTNLDSCLKYGKLDKASVSKVLGVIPIEACDQLYKAFESKDTNKIISLINDSYNNGYELHLLIRDFLDFCTTKSNMDLLERLLVINQDIRYDDSPKNLIIARLII